jgi:diguanylate cyclase (GGDEF)-like protein
MSIAVSLLGMLVLYGWIANIILFKSILPNYVPMRANAAIAFIMIGISLILHRPFLSGKTILMTVAKLFGLIVAIFGFISMIRMLGGYPLLIEQLYTFNYSPNDYSRLSPIAAFTFTLIGLSLMLLNGRRLLYFNQFLQVVIGLTGLLILTGYCFNYHSQIAIDTATHASLYTASGFILIALSMLCLQGGKGIMSLFISNTNGGIIARRLIPLVIIVPILLGYLRILGESVNLYDPQTGIEFYSACITTVLMIVTFFISKRLMSADRKRLKIEKQLRASHAELHDLYQKLCISEERFHNLAYHDSLTNLPNRRLLQDRLNHAIDFAKRHQNMMAVMFMDLDKFKYVNDTLGHDIGDELLKAVAARLNTILRSIDTIARVSGDEFVIILNELSTAHEAALIANKIIASVNERFLLHGHEVHIGCSIGITIYPNNGTEVSELMKKADLAMYTAKEAGRNQYRYYSH